MNSQLIATLVMIFLIGLRQPVIAFFIAVVFLPFLIEQRYKKDKGDTLGED